MQLDEEIEKAFKAGAMYAIEESFSGPGRDMYFPSQEDIEKATMEYINGNHESIKSIAVLDEGSSQTTQ
jgi:hypothetical protein